MVEPRAVEAGERVEVGRVVARVQRSASAGLYEERDERSALVGVDGRTDLEHLAPPARNESLLTRALRDATELRARCLLVRDLAVVVGEGEPLVLDGPLHRRTKARHQRGEFLRSWVELEPVVSDAADALDADESRRIVPCAAADAGDEEVFTREPPELRLRLLRHARELGPCDDRREHAVDVEDERRLAWGFRERRENRFGVHLEDNNTFVGSRLPLGWTLAGIGVAAGFFSALFGVGGGVVAVPLLILLVGHRARVATGTSLAAIGVTAPVGAIAFGALGEVAWAEAALVGLPAMGGVVVGTWLQQRVSSRALELLFAAFLVAVAVRLFLR